ncbi:2-oxo acid dehydrogenase subunit E2 [Halomonas elongata]|uniref:2-oxo acid dehydrogenase subunit E2 n=1 Tax=Halomonas elongata TaxID=2746 RepID=UPI0038D44CA3
MTDAARKPVSQISMEMKELAELVRLGKLRPHQYREGTVTLSNMGIYDIKQFGAIINPPHSMIIAIGAAERRSYSVNGGDAGASVISATDSFDHRAMDGTDGGALMQTFRDVIESPSKFKW